MITVYGIPNCDTVKKARAWLAAQDQAYVFYDFKKHGVPAERLSAWIQAAGWEKLLNRHGTTWRSLDPAVQASVQDACGAQSLMLANPSLIKRPVVEWPTSDLAVTGKITVGFEPLNWAKSLPSSKVGAFLTR